MHYGDLRKSLLPALVHISLGHHTSTDVRRTNLVVKQHPKLVGGIAIEFLSQMHMLDTDVGVLGESRGLL